MTMLMKEINKVSTLQKEKTYLKKVFDPFFRYQDKMNHSSGFEFGKVGMGMGLTIMKRYIGQIGGEIWFENKYEYEENKENVIVFNIEFST